MHRFVTLKYLVDSTEVETFPSAAIQNLRHAVLFPTIYKPNIQRALQSANFKFHRTCSYSELIRMTLPDQCNLVRWGRASEKMCYTCSEVPGTARHILAGCRVFLEAGHSWRRHDKECNVGEGETFLMFWGCNRSESRFTVMSTSSSSSVVLLPSMQSSNREREVRSTAQQTDICCRSPGLVSPANESEDVRVMRARIADSLTFSSPASSLLQPIGRSTSILGSVCALLLNKQGSSLTTKEVCSVSSVGGEAICRICFGGESSERLVRPCSCRGTIAAVHRACLERWLLQAASSYCELCRHHYLVTRTHKWSWVRSLAQWAWRGGGRALAADAARGAALGAASVLCTARALHACDRVLQAGARRGGSAALAANLLSSLLIGVIGALNGLLTTWMLLKVQQHQAAWRAWRDAALRVTVALDERAPSADTLVAHTHRATNVADPFMVGPPPPPP